MSSIIITSRVDPFLKKELPRNPKSEFVPAILGCVSHLLCVGEDKESVGQPFEQNDLTGNPATLPTELLNHSTQ